MTISICILPVVLWPVQPQATAHLSAPPVSKAILYYSAKWTSPVSHCSHPQLGSTASPSHTFSTSPPCFLSLGSPGCIRIAWQGEPDLVHSLWILMAVESKQTVRNTCGDTQGGCRQGFHTRSKWTSALIQLHELYIDTTTWHSFSFLPCVGTGSVFLLLSSPGSSSCTLSLVT